MTEKKSKRTSFVVHMDWLESMTTILSNEDLGKVFKALHKFRLDGTEPTESFSFSTSLFMAFHLFRTRMNSDDEKFEKTSEMRTILGTFGGFMKNGNVEGATKLYNELANLPKASIGYQTYQKLAKPSKSSKAYQSLANLAERRGEERRNLSDDKFENLKINSPLKKTKAKKENPGNQIILPAFVNSEIWNDFIADREERKIPMSTRAIRMAIKDLSKFEEKIIGGANASLLQSIKKGYRGVFEAKEYSQAMSPYNSEKKLSLGQKNRLIVEKVEQDFINQTKNDND